MLKELAAQMRSIDLQIRRLQTEITALESCLMPGGIRYDKDPVQSSPDDPMPGIMSDICDKALLINKLLGKKRDIIREMCSRIEAVEDDTQKLILTEYFVGQQSLNKIAGKMHYSKTRIFEIFTDGLKKANEPNETERLKVL